MNSIAESPLFSRPESPRAGRGESREAREAQAKEREADSSRAGSREHVAVPVVSVNARVRKDKVALVTIVVDVHDVEQLRSVMQRVGQVADVFNIERAIPT